MASSVSVEYRLHAFVFWQNLPDMGAGPKPALASKQLHEFTRSFLINVALSISLSF